MKETRNRTGRKVAREAAGRSRGRSIARGLRDWAVVVAFVASSVGCGVIESPITLALEEGSSMDILINPDSAAPINGGTVELEGGVETLMTAEIDFFDVLRRRPVVGMIEVGDLLFGGTEFQIFGIPTGAVCTTQDPNGASGGTVLIDIFDRQVNNASLEFRVDLASVIEVTNPAIAGLLPGGLPLTLQVDSEADLTLAEMLALISGDSDGRIMITQMLDERTALTLGAGAPIDIGIVGELTLSSVNEFPTGPLLDTCIAALGL